MKGIALNFKLTSFHIWQDYRRNTCNCCGHLIASLVPSLMFSDQLVSIFIRLLYFRRHGVHPVAYHPVPPFPNAFFELFASWNDASKVSASMPRVRQFSMKKTINTLISIPFVSQSSNTRPWIFVDVEEKIKSGCIASLHP